MKNNLENMEVSDKHVPLRFAVFILALLLAAGAFSYAVMRFGYKESGYYSIEAEERESVPYYAQGITLRYHCTGGSNGIKALLQELKGAYTAALLQCYELLDAENSYPDLNNLASVNEQAGSPVKLEPELFELLADAWEKTQENRGYSLLAGPFYAEWNSVRILENAADFDPLQNEEERERLAALAALTADRSAVFLQLDAASQSVTLQVDAAVQRRLQELEYTGPVLELNLLREADLLQLVAARMEEKGFSDGYLCTDSGLSLALSGLREGSFCLYGSDGEHALPAASMTAAGGQACSLVHVFAYSDAQRGYYTVEGAQGPIRRHPCVPADGSFSGCATAAMTVDPHGRLADACFENLALLCLGTPDAVRAAAAQSERPVAYLLEEGGMTVYVNAAGEEIRPETDYGFRLEHIG